jgi:hypothetical protein
MALYDLMGEDPKKKSEKVIIKKLLNKRMSLDNKSAFEIINNVASKTGVSPSFLAANALQEGMNIAINDDSNEKSAGYEEHDNRYDDLSKYPVDGFLYYGLDRFGEVADKLKKKGYIPEKFDYREYGSMNEKKQKVKTAAFKNNEDALYAKAAMIRDIKDSVNDYAKEKGIKLDQKGIDYFTMGAYNGGMGNAKIMLDELKKSGVNQNEFIDKGMTSRQGVHRNITPRIEKIGWIDKMMYGPVAPSDKKEFSLYKSIQ